MQLRYGLEWDREYFVDIVFWFNLILPFISTLTIYPANLYLLTAGPSMNREIRTAYLVNLRSLTTKSRNFPIAHVACDWILTIFVRIYSVSPYGLYYSEGILSRVGCSKQLIMGVLASGIITIIITFYILMMRMHQLTVAGASSRWKLSWRTQLAVYVGIGGICTVNMVGFVVFGTDVDNYEELVKEPELAWLVERGGTLLLYGEPGKASRFRMEILFLLVSAILFLPFLLLFIAHALIYLSKNEKRSMSTKTQLLTHRLFATFSLQTRGAIVFFILPIGFILTASVIDFSGFISGPVFASLRFISIMLLELNPPQLGLVFILRNATHRQVFLRRFMKLSIKAGLRKEVPKNNHTVSIFISHES